VIGCDEVCKYLQLHVVRHCTSLSQAYVIVKSMHTHRIALIDLRDCDKRAWRTCLHNAQLRQLPNLHSEHCALCSVVSRHMGQSWLFVFTRLYCALLSAWQHVPFLLYCSTLHVYIIVTKHINRAYNALAYCGLFCFPTVIYSYIFLLIF